MILRALKTGLPWLQPRDPRWRRRPLPWLIALTLLTLLVGGVLLGRFVLFMSSPDTIRFPADLAASDRADYNSWNFGPLIPPINPEAIEAAEAEPPPPTGPGDPGANVPIVVVGAATPSPTATVPPPTATATPPPPTATATVPPPTATATVALPTATPTRTSVPIRAPTLPPTRTAAPTSTPAEPSSTPVSRPEPPPVVPPTRTAGPTTPPLPTVTAAPTLAVPPTVQPTQPPAPTQGPSATATAVPPSPTATIEPTPLASLASAARTVGENDPAGAIALDVNLSRSYSRQVTVSYQILPGTAGATSDYSAPAQGTLTFEPGSTRQTIRIAIVRDNLDEPSETFRVRLVSGSANVSIGEPSETLVTIVDGDGPPTVSFAGDGRSVLERDDGATTPVTITVQLSGPSALDVAVPYELRGTAGQDDHSLRPGTLIIPAGQTAVRLRFNVFGDFVDEDDEQIEIRLGTPTNAQLASPSSYVITIIDDDTAGVRINPTALNVAEDPASAPGSYSVVLTSRPTAPVEITVRSPDGQLVAQPTTLRFEPGSWNVPQTVSVRAVDDPIDEPDTYQALLTHQALSGDPRYERLATIADVVVTIRDNDTAGLSISPLTLSLSEDPAASNHRADYRVALTSQPTAPVTVEVRPDAQLTVNVARLVFTADNWNFPQTVTVTAVDDRVDEDGDNNRTRHQGVVRHTVSSADPNYGAQRRFTPPHVLAQILDNDTARLVAPVRISITEGLTTTYSIRLDSQPTAEVRVALSADSPTLRLATTTLRFTPQNWNTPQPVTLTAADNFVDRPNPPVNISYQISSGDPIYDGLAAPDTLVEIANNDTAGVTISPLRLTASEAITATNHVVTYTVALTSEPTATVDVVVAAPAGQVLVSPTVLRFTPGSPANWRTPRTVTVTVIDDAIDEPSPHQATIIHAVASADATYRRVNVPTVTVDITDNDTAGVIVAPITPLALSEDPAAANHSATYSVRLASEPIALVQIDLAPDAQLSVEPQTLRFTADDWNAPQTVTVTAVEDAIDELNPHRGEVAQLVTSADPNYNGLRAPTVIAEVADNDTAGVTVTAPATSLAEGATISYTVQLDSQPLGVVTITPAAAPPGLVTLSPPSLSFSPANWNLPQTVAVTVLQNDVDAPDAVVTLSHVVTSAADPLYDAIAVAPVTLTVSDDDTAALLVSPTALAVNELPAAPDHSATYSVRLGSQPTATVTVTLAFDPDQIVATPTTLVFTPASWAISQTVTVTAVDDPVIDGPQVATIAHSISSGDPTYAALTGLPEVTVTVADDDFAGLEIGPATLRLGEGTAGPDSNSGTIELRLRSRPAAPVTVALLPDQQLAAEPPSLSFTPADWDLPQVVTLTALDDQIDERGDHSATLAFALQSADPYYEARAVLPYVVTIADDDRAALIVSPASGSITSEGGGSVAFSMQLATQPVEPVQVAIWIDPADEATVAGPANPLTFTAANWNSPVRVTVQGLNDDAFDGLVPFRVSFALAGDPAYAALAAAELPSYALANADDEPALVSIGDALPLLESDVGRRGVRFPIALRRASPVTMTVRYETFGLSAIPGEDFQPLSGTLSIAPGQTEAGVRVLLLGDRSHEPDEQFGVRLTAVDAPGDLVTLGDAQGIGTIRNNDPVAVRFAAGDTVVRESAETAAVVVRLDQALTETVRVNFTTITSGTAAGTAILGEDYRPISGELIFAPGEVEQTVALPILNNDDSPDERLETVRLALFNPLGAPTAGPSVASVTIVDDGAIEGLGGAPLFSTTGGAAAADQGFYRSGAGSDDAGFEQVVVPCGWPVGTPLTLELWSPGVHSDPSSTDRADGSGAIAAGFTSFELYAADDLDLASTLAGAALPAPLVAKSYPPSATAEGWEPFAEVSNPQPCSRYLLRALSSDTNQWAVRVAGSEAAPIAGLRNSVLQSGAADVQRCTTAWVAVPVGANELRLQNFDLDAPPGPAGDPLTWVAYFRPGEAFDPQARLGGLPGTASGDGVWASDTQLWPAAGWWRAVVCAGGGNRYAFEALVDGVNAPVYYDDPGVAPALQLSATADVAGGSVTVRYRLEGAAVDRAQLVIALSPELALAGDPCAVAGVPCQLVGDTVELALGSLAAGQSGEVLVPVVARPGFEGLGAVTLRASFRDGLGDSRTTASGTAVQLQ